MVVHSITSMAQSYGSSLKNFEIMIIHFLPSLGRCTNIVCEECPIVPFWWGFYFGSIDTLFNWCDKCFTNSHSSFGSMAGQIVNVAVAHFTNISKVNPHVRGQPNHHFIKTGGDKNLPREFERMYRVFKILQNHVKVWRLVMTWSQAVDKDRRKRLSSYPS